MGLCDTVTFKYYLRYGSDKTYPLSLYMPVKKVDTWKFTNGASGSWTEVDFSDSSWSNYASSGSASTTGTQYYRKAFTGLSTGAAAYEIGVNYRYGVVVYVNAVEKFRDNMPTGTPSSSTVANGSYTESAFRKVIRNAYGITTSAVLAIELHFLQLTHNTADFDAYIAFYASTTPSADSGSELFG